MKNSFFRRTGSYLPVLFFSIVLILSVSVSKSIGAVYDDFNGDQINSTLWDIQNPGGVLSQSGGLLNADGPPTSTYACLWSTQLFRGDFEFVLDYRDFLSTATVFTENHANIWLTVTDYIHDENFIYISRAYGQSGHTFNSNGKINGAWLDNVWSPASSVSGVLKISRTGSTITTHYNEGAGWVAHRTFMNAFTGDVEIQIAVYTGDNGTFHVSSDWITYEGQMRPPPSMIGMVDFDGDGKTDVSAFHLPSDQFFTDYSGNLGQYGWGGSDCYPLIWDYDGDGKTEVSVYHIPTNQWFVKGYPGDNLGQFGWGGSDSVPVPGDYNGDGIMERAFYHSPTNRWFVEGQDPVQFGWNGAECIPVPGDYDGDGKTDMALYHIPSNQWFLYGVGNLGQFGWGGADCIPVPGDYNGDGKTEIAIYHVPSNQWFWRDADGTAHFLGQYGWGGLESFPIPGDYDGDGVMERGFYRPSNNWWFIEGEPDFYWGWDGGNFIPITSQIAVYNWFRFKLHKFE